MTTAISPRHTVEDLNGGWTTDSKIEVFVARVEGWQLGVAKEIIDKQVANRGFGLLLLVSSYFEMIAKYRDGFASEGRSGAYFRRGVLEVFPSIQSDLPDADDLLEKLYDRVRNGLYHAGMTGANVLISDEFPEALGFDHLTGRIFISADKLVSSSTAHFSTFAAELRDSQNDLLRRNFELRFDFDNGN